MNSKTPVFFKNFQNFLDVLKVLKEENEIPFFIDKTMLIKYVLICPYTTILILKPQRWGKSFNLSILKYFLTIDQKNVHSDLSAYHFKIMDNKTYFNQHFKKYPLIYIDLYSITSGNLDSIHRKIRLCISKAFLSHYHLIESDKLMCFEKQKFKEYCDDCNKIIDFSDSIKFLCKLLKNHYNIDKNVVVLIDDYDFIPNSILEDYAKEIDIEKRKLLITLFLLASEIISQIIHGCSKNNEYLEKLVVFGINNILPLKFISQMANSIILNSINDFIFSDLFCLSESDVNQLIKPLRIEGEEKKMEGNVMRYISNEFNGYFNINNKRNYPIDPVHDFLIKLSFSTNKKSSITCESKMPLILDEVFSIYDEKFSFVLVSLLLSGKYYHKSNFSSKSLLEFITVSNLENYRTIFFENLELKLNLFINYGIFTIFNDPETDNRDLLLIPNRTIKKYVLDRYIKWKIAIIEELEEILMKFNITLDEDESFLYFVKILFQKIDKNIFPRINDIYIQSLIGLSLEKYALSQPNNDRNSYHIIYSLLDDKSKSYLTVFDSKNNEKPIIYINYKVVKKDKNYKDLRIVFDDLLFESVVYIFYRNILPDDVVKNKCIIVRVLILYEENLNNLILLNQSMNINYESQFKIINDFVAKNENMFKLLDKSSEYESTKSNILKLNDEFLKNQLNRRKTMIKTDLNDKESQIKIDQKVYSKDEDKVEPKFSFLDDIITKPNNIKANYEASSKKSLVINLTPTKDEDKSLKEDFSEDTDDFLRKDYFYHFIKNCATINKSQLIKNIYKLLENNENLSVSHFKNLGLRKIAQRILEDEETMALHTKFWEIKKNHKNKGEIQPIYSFFLKNKRKRFDEK